MNDRRYYRVGPAIWDEDWDDDTTLVAFYILTCGHRNTEGLFKLPLEYAIADLGADRWSVERFRKAFDRLLADGFIEYDESARVCLISKALEWQAPENPNQVKSALKKLADLPRTPLLARFLASADAHCERLAEGLRERFGERLGEPIAEPQSPSQTQTPAPSPDQKRPPQPPLQGGDDDSPFPSKPAGGRVRDREVHELEAKAWAAVHFPAAHVRHVAALASHLRSSGVEPTADAMRQYASEFPQWDQGICERQAVAA